MLHTAKSTIKEPVEGPPFQKTTDCCLFTKDCNEGSVDVRACRLLETDSDLLGVTE